MRSRTDDDNRTAGVVDALAEQVLTEAALLALEHIGQALECAVVRTGDRAAAAAVVDQSVNSLLQHALLVADDDVRRAQLEQALETVVAVDDAAVQIVQVGGREAAAVQLYHRSDLRRDDRDNVHDHPFRTVMRQAERLDDLEALDDAQALLAGGLAQLCGQLLGQLIEIQLCEQLLDGLRTHAGAEIVLVLFAHVAVLSLGEDLLLHERRIARIDNDIVGEVQGSFSRMRGLMSRIRPMRDGMPLKYQMCDTGAASSMWPMRSRRTLALVTSTPHLSQILPLKRTFLYLPQWHSQSLVGPKMRSQNRPSRSGLSVR